MWRGIGALVLLVTACGSPASPTAPPDVPSLAGTWTGTFTSSEGSAAIRADLSQDGSQLQGRWMSVAGVTADGEIVGRIDGTTWTGTLAVDIVRSDTTCLSSGPFSSPARTPLTITAPHLQMTNTIFVIGEQSFTCTPGSITNVTLTLTR